MLVGGLGGIGRATALWMADHGAKTIIFVSRSGLRGASSQRTVQALNEKGVRTIIHACDISQCDQVKKMMNDLEETAPPIGGAIQGAMILKVPSPKARSTSMKLTSCRTPISRE